MCLQKIHLDLKLFQFYQHKISIYLEDEILSLEHKALDRKAFALGALNLIEWIHRKSPGIYSVQDALNN